VTAASPRSGAGILFVLPALAAIGTFFFVPVLASLVLSITDFDIYAVASTSNLRWIGLGNYRQLLADPLFWTALGNTFFFVLVAGPVSIAASLGAALLLQSRAVRLRTFFRTVAVAVVWRYVYHPRYGLLNRALGVFGVPPIDWLGDPDWALLSICLLAVWKNFGFNMLIFVAALQAIPESLYEAASLDGASRWQQVRHVTLPMLAPTFLFVSILTLIGHFQLFAEPYVMTQGGPANATLSIVLLLYDQGFRWWNMGYAAAVAFVLFGILVTFTLLFRTLLPRRAAVSGPSQTADAEPES